MAAKIPEFGTGGYSVRDTDTRTYKVLRAITGFPDVGGTFSVWPWGEYYGMMNNPAAPERVVIPLPDVVDMVTRGYVAIVGPARLVAQAKKKEET